MAKVICALASIGVNMITQRFNPEWYQGTMNVQYMGMLELIATIANIPYMEGGSRIAQGGMKLIEIGSYMGESTAIFGMSGMFSEIHAIDPHDGVEDFNVKHFHSWETVANEFKINTRHWDYIKHHKDYSYNVADQFEDAEYDMLYIDGAHDYDSVVRDIELYMPKLKDGGIVCGHDYMMPMLDEETMCVEWKDAPHPGVKQAINEMLGDPHYKFSDSSWMFLLK